MSGATDADREKARHALGVDPSWAMDELAPGTQIDVTRIAAALAEEREKARAPFLALADEVEAYGVCMGSVVADEIRRAAEETQ